MRPAVSKMLSRFQTVFGSPPVDDDGVLDGFFGEFNRCLQHYDDATISKATNKLIDGSKFWPRPADAVEAAEHFKPTPVVASGAASNDPIIAHREVIKAEARRYMRECKSSLIDLAIRQGWSRSLEELARDVIRKCEARDGRMPSLRMMEGFRMPQDDVEYYARHGRDHDPETVREIIMARQQTGAVQPLRNVAGDA